MKKIILTLTGVLLVLVGLTGPKVAAQDVRRSLSSVPKLLFGDGSASLPSISFAADTATGLYRRTGGTLVFATNAQDNIEFLNSSGAQIRFGADGQLAWGSVSGNAGGSAGDTFLSRGAAGAVKVAQTATTPAELQVSGGNGGFISSVKALTELTTIAAAATTSTAIQIPANAIVLGVSVRVVTVIPTAATFTVTSATPTKTWNTAAVNVAATSTDPGTLGAPSFQTTASAITITPNVTPGAATGQVRVTIFYYTITPPTS